MLFSLFSLIFSLVVGAGSDTSSALHNIILGMLGGIVGSVLLGLIGLRAFGFVGDFVVSVLGACVCIWIARKIAR